MKVSGDLTLCLFINYATYARNSACKEGEEGAYKGSVGRTISLHEWTGLKFCGAPKEAENKINWRERVARSVAPQRSPVQRVVQRLFGRQVDNPGKKRLIPSNIP